MKDDLRQQQIKQLESALKEHIKSWTGMVSDMQFPDMVIPSKISELDARNRFSKMYDKYYHAQRKKAVTKLSKCKTDLGRQAFLHQYEYFKAHPEAKHKVDGFSHQEVCGIYETVLNEI